MNNLERLYNAQMELDKAIKEIEKKQSKFKEEIIEKRTIGWNKMFNDLYSLRKYSSFIDTGMGLYKSKKETLGFEIRNDNICVFSWKHFDCNGKAIEPRTETYFFSITEDKPFIASSDTYKGTMQYVIKANENWDEVMVEIEKRLSKKMETEMRKRILEVEQKQIELENQLEAISQVKECHIGI